MTGATLLTGPDAGDILRAALAPAGGQLLSWRATQVDYQPARASSAGYHARVRWPDRRVSEERFAAYTGTPPAGTLTVGDGEDRIAVWRFPHDPYLPGLATAFDPAAVARLLRGYRPGDQRVRLAVRGYRPRRRAVIEAIGQRGRLFLKVVRPSRVAALHRRHRLCTAAGVPVPPSLGYTDDGLLVLQALPGTTLRAALGDRRAPAPPPGTAVLSILDQLPGGLVDAPPRRSWLARAGHYAAVVAGVLPAEADRARQLGAELAAAIGASGTGPAVPVHGDFYESQLLVAGARITGLLDLDTAGGGERLDDLACLLGHLSVLAQIDPARAGAIKRLGARYLTAFEAAADPVDLRYRTAAVVLSLATGPHRVQEPGWPAATRHRLDLAERWLGSARRSGLMSHLSPASQGPLIPATEPGIRQPADHGTAHREKE